MSVVLPFLLVAVGCAVVMYGLWRLAARARRRRVSSVGLSGAIGVFDEIWHPAAYDPQIEVQVQYERQLPKPSPEDKDH